MTTLDLLDRLVGFPTVSADSNLDLIDWAEDLLRGSGARTQRIPDPTGKKAGLYACLGPDTDGGVLLSAHTDVVPVIGQPWSHDPFRLKRHGDRVYGRGTSDMKGFVASVLNMTRQAASRHLSEPLKIVLSYDEEVGCKGIAEMMPKLTPAMGHPRVCIVGEPTSMQIATGHKGKAAYRATCMGQSGHSAMAPKFRNALHLGADFLAALRQLQHEVAQSGATDDAYEVPYSTVHAGKFTGGTALNIVPDSCTIDYEIRHLKDDRIEVFEDRLKAAARAIGNLKLERTNIYPGLDVPSSAPCIKEIQSLLPDADITKVAFGTEAGFFQAEGIPTLVCGPGSMDQGHIPDEYIDIAQLDACDRFLGRLLDSIAA